MSPNTPFNVKRMTIAMREKKTKRIRHEEGQGEWDLSFGTYWMWLWWKKVKLVVKVSKLNEKVHEVNEFTTYYIHPISIFFWLQHPISI